MSPWLQSSFFSFFCSPFFFFFSFLFLFQPVCMPIYLLTHTYMYKRPSMPQCMSLTPVPILMKMPSITSPGLSPSLLPLGPIRPTPDTLLLLPWLPPPCCFQHLVWLPRLTRDWSRLLSPLSPYTLTTTDGCLHLFSKPHEDEPLALDKHRTFLPTSHRHEHRSENHTKPTPS